MFDNAVICKKLSILVGYYKEFKQLTENLTLDEYIEDIIKRRAIEREIQLIVESATDINNMILRKLKLGPARDYFNSFIDLAEADVFEMDFALEIAPSTGLRNILIHEYQEIDDKIVYNSIANVQNYYLDYIDRVSQYIGCK
jgi:uncharacterized protein YutE (UPF0331/DUF86 family)